MKRNSEEAMSVVLKKNEQIIPGKLEVLLVTKWKNSEAYTIPTKFQIQPDTGLVTHMQGATMESVQNMKPMELLQIYKDNNIRVILLDKKSYPRLAKSMTAHEMLIMGYRICQREGWKFTPMNLMSALANTEMD